MVDFMAQGTGHQFFPFDDECVAVSVHGFHLCIVRSFHGGIFTGNAQAALQTGLFSALGDDLGVHHRSENRWFPESQD